MAIPISTTLWIAAFVLFYLKDLDSTAQILRGLFVIVSSYSISVISEGKPWVKGLKSARFASLVYISYLLAMPESYFVAISLLALISVIMVLFLIPVKMS